MGDGAGTIRQKGDDMAERVKRYWEVEYSAANDGFESEYIGMTGSITILAVDIFEAMSVANSKIKEFGFDHFEVSGARILART